MTQTSLRLVDKETMDKHKALDAALTQIERAFGKGSIMRMGSRDVVEIDSISTGSLGLDLALGIGGLPRGRIVGNLRSGKLRQDHARLACGGRGAKKRAAPAPLSMPNMRSIPAMPASSASISMNC